MPPTSSISPVLSPTRTIAEHPVGNLPLATHHQRLLAGTTLNAAPDAWIDPAELAEFIRSACSVLAEPDGTPLVWKSPENESTSSHFTASLSFLIRHPWDLLRANEQHVSSLTHSQIEGLVHPSAVVEGVLLLGSGTRILPGVFIEGNAVIGQNCKIGPNCYIRGNTSIGDGCHIGQSVEIKNSLILSKTNVGHLSYVGDSVLGQHVNFGAGTTVSNLRHDGKNHRSMVNGSLIDTGRRKFGTIVGDGVHTGIHTAIYPGRKLWHGTSTRPGQIGQHDIGLNSKF